MAACKSLVFAHPIELTQYTLDPARGWAPDGNDVAAPSGARAPNDGQQPILET
jgi:hypothetical protein